VSVVRAVASRTDQAREYALKLISAQPGVQQRALVAAVQEDSDLATPTIHRLLQAMEREGVVEGRLDGQRKAYALPGAVAPVAAPPWAPARATARPAQSLSRGRRGELVAVVTALFVGAGLVAFVLAPNKDNDSFGGASAAPAAAPAPAPARARSQAPAVAPAKPKPKPKPKAKPRSAGALAAAQHTQVAVLSGSAVPGIASKTGDALKHKGFHVGTVTNAPGLSARSLVLYARGKTAAARALAGSLKIGATKPAAPSFQALAPKAGLIVVVGADRQR
jgi:hypothetical protein